METTRKLKITELELKNKDYYNMLIELGFNEWQDVPEVEDVLVKLYERIIFLHP